MQVARQLAFPTETRSAKGGITSSAASQTVVAANSLRRKVHVSNGGTTGVWLAFGEAAVVAQGDYLPSKSQAAYWTTQDVRCINETSGSAGPIAYTEWT